MNSSVEFTQYRGGYHEYRGGCSVYSSRRAAKFIDTLQHSERTLNHHRFRNSHKLNL